MAQYPTMPLFTDAIIADTVHLTPDEFGCYMRLLIFAWRTPDCRLPNDDLRLRTMLGLTPKRWDRMKPVLMQFFVEDEDVLIQKKLSKVRRYVAKSVAQKRDAGKRSAEARALKTNKTGSTGVSTGTPTERQRGGQQPKPNLYKYRGKDDFFCFWEKTISEGGTIPQTALSPTDIDQLISRGNVTKDQMEKSGLKT